jgi:hypothetical protein
MAQRETPITAFVFWPAEREDPYLLPALTRGTCLYGTPTTIRVRLDHNLKDRPQLTLKHTAGEQTQRKEGLYCMPNEETWEEFLNELATLQDALTALKDVVATLPVYSKRRDELERQKVVTNPVCRSGIQIWPIGKRVFSHWEPWAITSCRRGRVMGHSMHNIRIEGSGSMSNNIYDWHCCLTEADWQRTSAAHKVTKEAMGAVARRIQSLGKYHEAVKDLRYRDVQKPGMSAEVGMFEKKAPAKKRPRAAKQKTPTKQAEA